VAVRGPVEGATTARRWRAGSGEGFDAVTVLALRGVGRRRGRVRLLCAQTELGRRALGLDGGGAGLFGKAEHRPLAPAREAGQPRGGSELLSTIA